MLQKSRFRYLTLLLLLNFVIGSLLDRDSSARGIFVAFMYSFLILALVWAYRREKKRLGFLLGLNLIMVIFRWVNIIMDSHFFSIAILIAASLFFIALAQSLFRSLLHSREVDADILYGAIATYILLGNLWSSLYSIIYTYNPASFTAAQGDVDLLYFSFVTLTSLGYGDISPVSNMARMAAAAEGIAGTLYVAIVISRVVGLYISNKPQAADREIWD